MRRTPLKRRQAARRTDPAAAEAWHERAAREPCAVCGQISPANHGHHALTQQALRNRASELGLDIEQIRWDQRNHITLCPRHHAAHHNASGRVTLATILAAAPKLQQFARELDLEWRLQTDYA